MNHGSSHHDIYVKIHNPKNFLKLMINFPINIFLQELKNFQHFPIQFNPLFLNLQIKLTKKYSKINYPKLAVMMEKSQWYTDLFLLIHYQFTG